MSSNGRRTNRHHSGDNLAVQMDYGPTESSAPTTATTTSSSSSRQRRTSQNGGSHSNSMNHSSSFGSSRRRSSLGLGEDGTLGSGGGVPNPYGYTAPSEGRQTTRARKAAAAAAAKNQQQQNQNQNGNSSNTTNDGPKLPKRSGSSSSSRRRDSNYPGGGAGGTGGVQTARGRGGVMGIVRQGSARLSLGSGGSGSGPNSSATSNKTGGRPGPTGTANNGIVPERNAVRGIREKFNQQNQQQQHPPQPPPVNAHQRQKQKIKENTQRSSGTSLLDQDHNVNSNYDQDDGERSYNSLFDEEESIESQSEGSMSEESLNPMNAFIETDDLHQSALDAKKDALVESLVWFSHHTPRTVLEDLVSHEIEIWQAERGVDMTIMEGSCESFEESNHMKVLSSHSGSGPQRNSKRQSKKSSLKQKKLLDGLKEENNEDSFMADSQMEESAVSELSDEQMEFYDGNFSESILKLQQGQPNADVMIKLPKMVEREGAVIFADISGFTKLSTMLDCESLSKVINSYFDMIVNEVVSHGGDILKFAGDAFFAEWKVNDYEDGGSKTGGPHALSTLGSSLSTNLDLAGFNNDDDNIPRLSTCVLAATKCAAAIVEKFSDFSVGAAMPHAMPMIDGVRAEAMLNVHCGVGAGKFVGLHVGDYKEDPDEEGVVLRREFLVMGDPIDQAAVAADAAVDGEVLASAKSLASLAFCCPDMPQDMKEATEPMCIATRGKTFFSLEGDREQSDEVDNAMNNEMSRYEALRTHCRDLNQSALARLHLQMALYVHPVIRDDELALSAQIRQGKIATPQSTIEDRHLAEAELRSVFTIFINAVMTTNITGDPDIDGELYSKLGDIMHVVSRELDRYSGHLRQFIVDDKGVVLIATFGLRGSTFPNMVANNGLPATFAIHRSLKAELQVDNRIGTTFGKVYCGVVGGVRRHEFAVMGAAVNLAARLMASKMNKGILVDEAVRAQAGSRIQFKSLQSIVAKGYDQPVAVFEPDLNAATSKRKKSSVPFVGRREERNEIAAIAQEIIEEPDPTRSSMVFLMGECGMGKSALGVSILDEVKKAWAKSGRKIIAARSTTTETEQRIPLSSFRKVFLSAIRDLCEQDGTIQKDDNKSVSGSDLGRNSRNGMRSGHNKSPLRPGLARADRGKLDSLLGGDVSLSNESFHTDAGNSFEIDSVATSNHSALGYSQHSGKASGGGMIPIPASLTREQRAQSENRPSQGISIPLLQRGLSAQSTGGIGNPQTPYHTKAQTRGRAGTLGDSMHGGSSLHGGKAGLHGGLGGGPPVHNGSAAHMALKRRESVNPSGVSASPVNPGGRRGSISHAQSLTQSLHGGNPSASLHGGLDKTQWPKSGPLGPVMGRGKNKRTSLMRLQSNRNPLRAKSVAKMSEDDGNESVMSLANNGGKQDVPYFEKLCQICEEIEYPYEYADIVGSQFLGLDGASPVTHVEGHVPTINELVEFLSQAFICITNYSDLSLIFVDDFQWVDSFTWKIFRELCERGKKMLLICAMRSHDKQALRRLSAAITQSHMQSQMIEISLGPLDLLEIREMIAKVLGYGEDAVDESLCSDIYQKTGGLPVYVAELLENIKRNKTVAIDESGTLRWTPEAEKEQKGMASKYNSGAVMEETFLSRFDALDVRVRKVLQTCAVLGLSFSLSDVVRVHPELEDLDIENALDNAVEEIILVERFEDEDESVSLHSGHSGSTGCDSDSRSGIHELERGDSRSSGFDPDDIDDRFFEFSHAMWRQKVLTTMLKERKIELHRLIAEAMEKDQVHILEQCDISRLLTLFDHWKACGDFCKSAPLALAVGSRLEEWDLAMQSLDLYRDALEMSFESVEAVNNENGGRDDEWVQVSAHPEILDLILRLHIRIGLCHQRLGDEYESVMTFEDAYKIVKTSSKIPGMSRTLMMPIISTLCALKLERDAADLQTRKEQEGLVRIFVEEAREDGHPVHISRALAMAAMYFAKQGYYERALAIHEQLQNVYDVLEHSGSMIQLYGYDYAVECFSESVQWYYLVGRHESAERQAEIVIHDHVPLQDQTDIDNMLRIILPVIQVLKLLDRAKDSDLIFKKFIINSFHDHAQSDSDFWVPLFNPLAYLLEVIKMEEEDRFDHEVLQEMESWVLEDENSVFHVELERKAHTWMGELCWRLANLREDDDPVRPDLVDKARELLEPVALTQHPETFLKQLASALLDAL